MTERKRIYWIDIAKFFGIFMIVYGHTIQEGFSNKYVYSFHVPFFFLLLGVVASVTKVKEKKFLPYLKNKAYALLIPYYSFAIISTAVIYVVSKFISFPESEIFLSPWKLITNILIGNCEANQPLWFLPCTFVISVLSFIIIRLSETPSKTTYKKLIITACIVVPSVALYVTDRLTHLKFIPYKADTAFFMLPFFFAGYALMEYGLFHKAEKTSTLNKLLLAVFLLVFGVTTGLWNGEAGYLGNYYGHISVFYISALSSSIAFCLISMMIPDVKVLSYVGQSSLCILLMHKFPVLAFQKVLPFTGQLLANHFSPAGVVVTVIAITLCCLAQIILAKICPFFIGKRIIPKN